jgi:hypothetical protein
MMQDFKKTINNSEFNFQLLKEGEDMLFRVNVDNQSFRMITDDNDNWGIWQQVPKWIKDIEEDLANAIEDQLDAE